MSADRNLLFGILALQLNFVTRNQLIEGMNKWVLDKNTSLGKIFVSMGAMDTDHFQLLDALVDKHVEKFDGDIQQSIQQLSSVDPYAPHQLKAIEDPELNASLARLPGDPFATKPVRKPTERSSSRFRIIRQHARGGLGEVYVAEDTELSREVALKEIQGSYADDADSRERFLREAEITGNLEHPGIVPVYALGKYDDGRPYYAMRFIRGESLKQAIDAFHAKIQTRLTVGDAGLELRKLLRRLVDVCNAVAYAHSRGVLHRDLKPGNIILGKYGETLVVDWGLAKAQGQASAHDGSLAAVTPSSGSAAAATVLGSALGTPAYMSPEQAAGKVDELGPATDVYSLGATLFHLLTGQLPIVGDSANEIVSKAQTGEIRKPREIRSDIPKALEYVCLKAMSVNPSDRYASTAILAEEIEKWLADEPVKGLIEPLQVRGSRWVRRHPVLTTACALASVLTTVFLGVFIVSLKRSSAIIDEKNEKLVIARDQARSIAALMSKVVTEFDPLRNANTGSVIGLLNQVDQELSAYGESGDELAARIYLPMAHALGNFGSYPDATRVLERLITVQERLNSDSLTLDMTKWELGSNLMRCGKADQALLVFKDVLAKRSVAALGERPFIQSQLTLGDAYRYNGDFESARKELEVAMKAIQELKGPGRIRLLSSCENNLALVYAKLNMFTEADELYQRSTEHAIQTGEHEFQIAIGRFNHAYCLSELGQYAKAKQLLYLTLEPIQRVNPNHPMMEQIREQLGALHFKLGEFKEAVPWLRASLSTSQASEQMDPESRKSFLERQVMLGDAYRFTGELDPAKNELENALRTIRELDGPDGLSLLSSGENNLALVYLAMGELSEAHNFFELATEHAIRAAAPGPELAVIHFNHAACLRDHGQLDKAKELLTQASQLVERVQPDHPVMGRIQGELGALHFQLGEFQEAVPQLRASLNALQNQGQIATGVAVDYQVIFAQSLAKLESPELSDVIQRILINVDQSAELSAEAKCAKLDPLGRALLSSREWKLAEQILQPTLQLRTQLDAKSWATYECQWLLGKAIAQQQRYTEADKLLSSSLSGMKSMYAELVPEQRNRILDVLETAIGSATDQEATGRVIELTRERDDMKAKVSGPEANRTP